MRLMRTRTASALALSIALGTTLLAGLAEASGSAAYPADSLTMDPARQQRPELAALLGEGRRNGQTDVETLTDWVVKNRWEPGEPVGQVGRLDDLDAANLEDLLAQKRNSPAPLADIIARYGSQQAFQDASWKLAKLFPKSYAGMLYRVGADDRVRMLFNGTVPPEALNLVEQLPETVAIEGGDFVPESQQQGLIDRSFAVLRPLVKHYSVAFDAVKQNILIQVTDSDRSRIPELTDAVSKSINPVPAVVETGYTATQDLDSVMRGGASLFWATPAETGGCTAGFVIESGSGALRLGTAGHCIQDPNAAGTTVQTYTLESVDGSSATPVNNMWWTNNYGTPDLGYTSHGSFTPIGVFYYNPGLKRTVQGAASTRYANGTSVCFYGQASGSGNSCGYVTNSNISLSIPGGSGLVATDAIAQHGDSGGPWFRGNWAVGQTVKGDLKTVTYYAPVFQYEDYGFHVLLY